VLAPRLTRGAPRPADAIDERNPVIVAGFGAGVLGGWLAGLPGYFRRRTEAAAAAKRIRELEAEAGVLKKTIAERTPPPTGNAQ